MKIDFKPGDMVERSEDPGELAVLISENDFHRGYWKVLIDGEVAEWFAGNFVPAKEKKPRHTRLS